MSRRGFLGGVVAALAGLFAVVLPQAALRPRDEPATLVRNPDGSFTIRGRLVIRP